MHGACESGIIRARRHRLFESITLWSCSFRPPPGRDPARREPCHPPTQEAPGLCSLRNYLTTRRSRSHVAHWHSAHCAEVAYARPSLSDRSRRMVARSAVSSARRPRRRGISERDDTKPLAALRRADLGLGARALHPARSHVNQNQQAPRAVRSRASPTSLRRGPPLGRLPRAKRLRWARIAAPAFRACSPTSTPGSAAPSIVILDTPLRSRSPRRPAWPSCEHRPMPRPGQAGRRSR